MEQEMKRAQECDSTEEGNEQCHKRRTEPMAMAKEMPNVELEQWKEPPSSTSANWKEGNSRGDFQNEVASSLMP